MHMTTQARIASPVTLDVALSVVTTKLSVLLEVKAHGRMEDLCL